MLAGNNPFATFSPRFYKKMRLNMIQAGVRGRHAGLIQRGAQFVGKHSGREGFLQQHRPRIQSALMRDGIFSVSGSEQDFDLRRY